MVFVVEYRLLAREAMVSLVGDLMTDDLLDQIFGSQYADNFAALLDWNEV